MTSPTSELERLIAGFRHEQGVGYLRQLGGEPRDERVAYRARTLLTSERGLELLEATRAAGELEPSHDAAVCAHLARARLEQCYAPARSASSGLLAREVSVEGDTRAVGALANEWLGAESPTKRERAMQAMGPELERHAAALLRFRSQADASVAALFAEIGATRHPDAGPEGGADEAARAWLADSAELSREALAFSQRALAAEGHAGLDHLWVALGLPFQGLFPRESRFRRLAAEWEPLGLRRLLSTHGRAAADHSGPFLAPHVVALSPPRDVRVSAAAREYGLASELAAAEAIGRAVGLVHGSEALPFPVRFASVGTVARAVGSLAVLRLTSPRYLRKVRELSSRESDLIARIACTYYLLESRLSAAAVLARRLTPSSSLDEAAALAERALLGPVPRGSALLVLRVSPGGPFRAKALAPALSAALREQYDEDWYANPRASEPLRGALLRAGTFSVEGFATELGADATQGIRLLSELF